eukprot:11221717-Lingulodinium_polyedra.AAC.1
MPEGVRQRAREQGIRAALSSASTPTGRCCGMLVCPSVVFPVLVVADFSRIFIAQIAGCWPLKNFSAPICRDYAVLTR